MRQPSAGCVASDLIWETFAWGAEKARQAGYAEEAHEQWRLASRVAETFDAADPRRAASMDSLGVCHRLAGDLEHSERMHRQALELWQSAMGWVAAMPVALKPSSVSYHRGLQDRFRDDLTEIARHQKMKLAGAGQAATRNNLACVLLASDRLTEAAALLEQAAAAWRASFGARDEGLASIHHNCALLFDRQARPEPAAQERLLAARILDDPATRRMTRFARDCDRRMTPQRRLMAAVYLATGPYMGSRPV
ncbi:MAG: hypothetical protein CVT84_03750 [Alphaproteobacteria bacterium HGW-Alphaproteobacteria-6]|nr:MAG: hypothetical protein CVT84_03750 [Alphaproteobacteria bacterium HGW-Alphaproteobacteria-6]